MEKLRATVAQIAATADKRLPELPVLHRSLLPFLSLASCFYRLCLYLRRRLYLSAILRCRRFPVPVISVGNLTWGGNGKTPMVEFIARYLDELGIPPLILSRGKLLGQS
ncbi:probable tetraacyldisaccharide 4'-kinase, mitochondrial isoform X2 [Dendrobium catenatum]|uniref:probable tetraacyldisaccharide 4'-kinase, mitochondrial isoform X2 n=1 Tax=Dendrobium catenatum TaxID=906689 RepID=UPI0009F69CBC|nr:probable tetraacyldisaccharide 4'-kinase, mitochondrial isoform X2 [Dendrobium catenatum]